MVWEEISDCCSETVLYVYKDFFITEKLRFKIKIHSVQNKKSIFFPQIEVGCFPCALKIC